MAGFNEILTGRYNRALQKLLSMKGPASLSSLASEIYASFPLFWGAENRYLESWNLFASSINNGGVAANFGVTQWRNPPGSNVVAVFMTVYQGGLVSDQPMMKVGPQLNDLATLIPLTVSRIDNRGNPQPTLICSRTATPGVLTFPMFQRIYAGGSGVDFIITDIQELTVLPGDALQIGSNAANQAQITSTMWRERLLEESERA